MKVDWNGVLATAAVAVVAMVAVRTVEEVFPATRAVTDFPVVVAKKFFG